VPSFDPVASFEITAVEATLCGRLLRIPALPASEWLAQLMRTSDALALMALLEDDPTDELFADGLATAADVRVSLEGMLEVAAGCKPWTAFCLAAVAREHWQYIGGELVRSGVRLAEISLGAALVAVYTTVSARLDEKALASFNRALESPMPAQDSVRSRIPRDALRLPAIAEQYARVRPKTVPRRPQDPQDVSSGQPTPLPSPPADSAAPSVDGQLL
jgi:hypothetical protein